MKNFSLLMWESLCMSQEKIEENMDIMKTNNHEIELSQISLKSQPCLQGLPPRRPSLEHSIFQISPVPFDTFIFHCLCTSKFILSLIKIELLKESDIVIEKYTITVVKGI